MPIPAQAAAVGRVARAPGRWAGPVVRPCWAAVLVAQVQGRLPAMLIRPAVLAVKHRTTVPVVPVAQRLPGWLAALVQMVIWDGAVLAVAAAGVIVTTNNDKTGYALTAAYDAAKTAATQASVDDIPTNAELATSQAAADDATLAAIAALNNISTAQVNTEVDTALADVGLTTTVTGRIDAAITSRMASYTQPTGFLAATFPSDPADQSLVIAATDAVMSRLGAPTGASMSADIAAAKADTAAIKLQTDKFVFTVANQVDSNIQYVNDVQLIGTGVEDTDEWRPA
jgi:hypothetical protein